MTRAAGAGTVVAAALLAALCGCGGAQPPSVVAAPAPGSTSNEERPLTPAQPPEPPGPPAPPSDRDGDGVPDDIDACPDKPGMASAVLRENGCLRRLPPPPCDPESVPRFTFGAGSAKPLRAADAMVKILAETLNNHPEIILVGLEGFAEPGEGSASKLGMRRANSVADRLISLGVAPERITRAWGEGAPRTDCGGCPCRDIGRRIVELVILQRTDRGPVGQFSRPGRRP